MRRPPDEAEGLGLRRDGGPPCGAGTALRFRRRWRRGSGGPSGILTRPGWICEENVDGWRILVYNDDPHAAFA
jgi:hypothetical protein